jgi:hypothetical protein
MKKSKTFMLATIFFLAVASVWGVSASQAETATAHTPSMTAPVPHPSAQSPHAATVQSKKPVRIAPIKTKPAQILDVPGGSTHPGCIEGGTGPSQPALCGN